MRYRTPIHRPDKRTGRLCYYRAICAASIASARSLVARRFGGLFFGPNFGRPFRLRTPLFTHAFPENVLWRISGSASRVLRPGKLSPQAPHIATSCLKAGSNPNPQFLNYTLFYLFCQSGLTLQGAFLVLEL